MLSPPRRRKPSERVGILEQRFALVLPSISIDQESNNCSTLTCPNLTEAHSIEGAGYEHGVCALRQRRSDQDRADRVFQKRQLLKSKWLMFGSLLKKGLRRSGHFWVSARRSAPFSRKFRIHSALIRVFFAVDRRNVRRIFIEIGSPDPIFLAMRVNPLPQDLG